MYKYNMYNKIFKFFAVLFVVPFLSGCSTVSESFDTKPGKGVGFKSVSDVNQMVEDGKIEGLPLKKDAVTQPIVTLEKPSMVDFIPTFDSKVMRRPEKHMRVWVAPYQDGTGNFHEGSVVHTLINHGTWHMFKESV